MSNAHLRHKRAGHLSDLKNKLNTYNSNINRSALDDYKIAYTKFEQVHLECMKSVSNEADKEALWESYYEQRAIFLDVLGKNELGSHKSNSNKSGFRMSDSDKSGSCSSTLERKRLIESQIRLQALQEEQKLEKELEEENTRMEDERRKLEGEKARKEKDLERKKKMLAAITEMKIAEESFKVHDSKKSSTIGDHSADHQETLKRYLKDENHVSEAWCDRLEKFEENKTTNKAVTDEANTTINKDVSNDTISQLANAITRGNSLPAVQIMTFSGNPIEYAEFKLNLKENIEPYVTENQLFTRLIAQTTGKAKDSIRSCVSLPQKERYKVALNILYENFGLPYMVSSAHIKNIKSLRVPHENSSDLLEFSRNLKSTQRVLGELGENYSANLDNEELLKCLMNKLPSIRLKHQWSRYAGKLIVNNKVVKFKDFVEFVYEQGRELNNPYAAEIEERKPIKKVYANTVLAKSRTSVCSMCKGNHMIWACHKFKELVPLKRSKVVQRERLCRSCLCTGHWAKDCLKNFVCSTCKKNHNSLLHVDYSSETQRSVPRENKKPENADEARSDEVSTAIFSLKSDVKRKVCFKLVPIKIKNKDLEVETYAFLDGGADTSLVHESLLNILKIPQGDRKRFNIHTVNGTSHVDAHEVSLNISSMDNSASFSLNNVLTTRSLPVSKSNLFQEEDTKQWSHLKDVCLYDVSPKHVLILIGNDHPEIVEEQLETRKGNPGDPVAIRTPLGWTICGPVSRPSEDIRVNFTSITIEEQLRLLYNTEFEGKIVSEEKCMSPDDAKALKIMESSVKLVDGHFQVNIPFKAGCPDLPNNFVMAKQRLMSLKKKLEGNEEMKTQYFDSFNKYIEEGSAIKVEDPNELAQDGKTWYLPHHGVWSSRKPEPRIVFDCAAKFKGTSLNDQLHKGPENMNLLTGVLLRLRVGKVAVAADIKRMFHQVFVPNEQRSVFRYLWYSDTDFSRNPDVYEMKVHIFGAKSSPSVCQYALKKTVEYGECSAQAVDGIQRDFYVDDLLKSYSTPEEAIKVSKEIQAITKRGGFVLTKWFSTDRSVLEEFSAQERAPSFSKIDISKGSLPVERALGITWDTENDTLAVVVKKQFKASSRRGILSTIASIYDPLGVAGPLILPGREILQDLCRRGFDWDATLPEDIEVKWNRWIDEMSQLGILEIPRTFLPNDFENISNIELHHFADASELHGYGTVSYLRFVNTSGKIYCSFIYGRSRVRPLKSGISVPRLELSAATALISINEFILRELQGRILVNKITYWSDSQVVLKYISNEKKELVSFVANRVAKILDGSSVDQWKYVPSESNTADYASRGVRATDSQKIKGWLRGPDFLWKAEIDWPQQKSFECELSDECEGVRKSKVVYAVVIENEFWSEIFSQLSSWSTLIRAIARLVQVKRVWKALMKKDKKENESPQICANDFKEAELQIVSAVQGICSSQLSRENLLKLKPIAIDGILHVGGRLSHSHLPSYTKHQKILPAKHHVTEMLIKHYHNQNGHAGVQHTLSELRKHYWIVKGASTVRKVIQKCFDCRRYHGRPSNQVMGSLPDARVSLDKAVDRFPFSHVGIDYFGPFSITTGRLTRSKKTNQSTKKRYGCIFTCLKTRAVHIEMAKDLTSDSFIQAFMRFVARRGSPVIMYSDNGTNFRGANRDIIDALKSWNEKIINTLGEKGIQWIFNPPSASHYGGVWERIIRSIRRILDGILKERLFNDEVLHTALCEVEKILNNRPITKLSTDLNDLDTLSPSQLLLLRENPATCPNNATQDYHRCHWKTAQELANLFWSRWRKEYLPTLQERQKWLMPSKGFHRGDLVLIVDKSLPRGEWRKGIIEVTYPDSDNVVRQVSVRTQSGVFLRDIRSLCLLESQIIDYDK